MCILPHGWDNMPNGVHFVPMTEIHSCWLVLLSKTVNQWTRAKCSFKLCKAINVRLPTPPPNLRSVCLVLAIELSVIRLGLQFLLLQCLYLCCASHVRLPALLARIRRNPQHQRVVRRDVQQVEKEWDCPSAGGTFARIRTHQLIQHVHAALCRVVILYDFWFSAVIWHDVVVPMLRRQQDHRLATLRNVWHHRSTVGWETEHAGFYLSVSCWQHIQWDLLAISSDCPHQHQLALGQLLGELIAGKRVVGGDIPSRVMSIILSKPSNILWCTCNARV